MKFQVQFKDPDTVHDSIKEAVMTRYSEEMSEEEIEAAAEVKISEVSDFTDKWIKYGEYVTIEFDTEAKTCVVIPQS